VTVTKGDVNRASVGQLEWEEPEVRTLLVPSQAGVGTGRKLQMALVPFSDPSNNSLVEKVSPEPIPILTDPIRHPLRR